MAVSLAAANVSAKEVIMRQPSARLTPCMSAVFAIALLAPFANAQNTNPYSSTCASCPSPYWGYSFHPYGGYLGGVADAYRAQGQWLKDVEASRMLREKPKNSSPAARSWNTGPGNAISRTSTTTANEAALERRSKRVGPSPLTEILAASSLNVLLVELKKMPNLSQVSSIPVESAWLPHIHVTFVTNGAGGSIGLLKRDHLAVAANVRHRCMQGTGKSSASSWPRRSGKP